MRGDPLRPGVRMPLIGVRDVFVSRTTPPLVLALAMALAVAPVGAHAAILYKVKGNVIANGGAWGTNATQGSVGTAGQPITGYGAKLFFRSCSGFWCFGGTRVIGVDDDPGSGDAPGASLPKELSFGAPSPNPSRGEVRFALGLPKDAEVTFTVYDVAGRLVGEPVMRRLSAGEHQLRWSAPADHAGVYFGLLRVDGEVKGERRIVLVR